MGMKLSEDLKCWRAERPDEWTMDAFIRKAVGLEQFIEECRDSVLHPLAHEGTELGKIAEGLGGATHKLLKTSR